MFSLSGSERNNDNLANLQAQAALSQSSGYNNHEDKTFKPVIATPDRMAIYDKFSALPVIIEGPEYTQDYTYFLVDEMRDLFNLEKGLTIEEFQKADQSRIGMEFRVL